MAHIIILGQWEELIEQLHNYSEQIANEMGTYDKERAAEAQGLLSGVETFIGNVNTSYRTELDAQIASLEGFLGI